MAALHHLALLAVGAAAFTATTPATTRKPDTAQEFGDELDLSLAFFREEGRPARDLAVLACSHALGHKETIRVLDACAGAGARTLRYLRDLPGQVEVLANEPNDGTQLEANCRTFAGVSFASGDAAKLLDESRRRFDVVDVDAFGLGYDPSSVVNAAADGGVVLLATTGAAAAGMRGAAARAALRRKLGCAACKTPAQNELGLRMLLGAAARAAAADGAVLRPLFAHYAPHGPVFRVAAVVDRCGEKDPDVRAEQFLACCRACGQSTFLPAMGTHCGACGEDLGDDSVAGPVWAGPLHDAAAIKAMRADAEEHGWLGDRGYSRKLKRLLDTLVDESRDPDLDASLFVSLDDVARRASVPTPSNKGIVAALTAAGFRAAATHVEGKAVKTDAPMVACVECARACDAGSS